VIVIIPLFIVVGVIAWALKPGKQSTQPRRIAILVTAAVSFIVAIAAIVFQLVHNAAGTVEVADISNTCFIVGLGLIGADILASVGFAIAHRGEVARGTGFGTCVAIIISILDLGLLEWLGGV